MLKSDTLVSDCVWVSTVAWSTATVCFTHSLHFLPAAGVVLYDLVLGKPYLDANLDIA